MAWRKKRSRMELAVLRIVFTVEVVIISLLFTSNVGIV